MKTSELYLIDLAIQHARKSIVYMDRNNFIQVLLYIDKQNFAYHDVKDLLEKVNEMYSILKVPEFINFIGKVDKKNPKGTTTLGIGLDVIKKSEIKNAFINFLEKLKK